MTKHEFCTGGMSLAELSALPEAEEYETKTVVLDTQEKADEYGFPRGTTIHIPTMRPTRVLPVCGKCIMAFEPLDRTAIYTPHLVQDANGEWILARKRFLI